MKLTTLFEKDLRTNKTVWGILHTSDKLLLGKRAPGTNNPIITDPFSDYADWVKTKAFMVYQEPRHLDGAINVVTGRAKHDSN